MAIRIPANQPFRFGVAFALMLFLTGCAHRQQTKNLRAVISEEIGRDSQGIPSYRCTVGAHRGSSVEHHENTLPALLAAEEDPRFGFVEFDVQYTKDAQIVVFHDHRLLRRFGKFDSIGESTFAELSQASGGEIILYKDVIPLLGKKLNIEIKSQGDSQEDERLADAIIEDIQDRRREDDVMISSISSELISYINQRYPLIPTGQIYWLTSSTYVHFDILTENLYNKLNETQADYLMLHVANLRNIDDLIKFKPPEKTLIFWNFNDRMYLVHKDRTDRIWGTSSASHLWRDVVFKFKSPNSSRAIRTRSTSPRRLP